MQQSFGGIAIGYILLRSAVASLGVKYGTCRLLQGCEVVTHPAWVLARMGDFNSPHIWAWWMLGLVGLYITWRTRRPFIGFLGVLFMGSVHELGWYAAYFAHNQGYWLGNLIVYSPFMGFVAGLIVVTGLLGFWRYVTWRGMLVGWALWAGFAAIWILGADFRLSLDLKAGATAYFADAQTNALEFISVFLASVAMVAGVRAPPRELP